MGADPPYNDNEGGRGPKRAPRGGFNPDILNQRQIIPFQKAAHTSSSHLEVPQWRGQSVSESPRER